MASSTFEAKLVEEFRDLKAQAKQGPVAPHKKRAIESLNLQRARKMFPHY